MQIDYTVELDYGDDNDLEGVGMPTADDIARWIRRGMATDGEPSADITVERAQ